VRPRSTSRRPTETLHVLLKYQSDIQKAAKELSRGRVLRTQQPCSTSSKGSSRSCGRQGLPVSLTENLDAMEAVQHIPMEDREAFKYALAATLVKNHAHWKAFETVFEVYFFSLSAGLA